MRATLKMALAAIGLLALPSTDALARQRRPHQTPPPAAPVQQQPAAQPPAPVQQAPVNDEGQQNTSGHNSGVRLYPPGSPSIGQTPVSNLFPGKMSLEGNVRNPVEGDPEAIQRGMSYFDSFNCSGCHAANGGGGMGPALSNKFFIYGDDPANIYLSIYQGRPNGMPAWGAMLPENIIWDLVAYIKNIAKAPTTGWGRTASHDAWVIQQLPAEFSQTPDPWSQTERFSFGQSPSGRR